MKPRTVLFWIHFAIGVAGLTFIFVMSATGALLAYQRQILAWYDTHAYRAAPPSPDTPRLPPDRLAAAVRAAAPDATLSSLTLHADPTAPAEVGAGRRVFFVNPYSGRLFGERTDGPRPFFRAVSAWHTGLGAGRDGPGHTIAAAANLAVVLMVFTGLTLWVPRHWTTAALRQALWFRRGLPSKARHFNWHHVVGIWAAIPLLVIVVGALPMSYMWASDLVFLAVGQKPEPRRAEVRVAGAGAPGPAAAGRAQRGGGRGRSGARTGSAGARPVPLERVAELWAGVERQNRGWQTITARLPPAGSTRVEFTIERGTSQQPQKRSVLTLDAATGDSLGLVTFGDRTRGARLRTYLRFAHTGEVLGFPTQTIAAAAALAACMMCWTGLALSWRRFVARRSARTRHPAAV